jgi:hypothetical protein
MRETRNWKMKNMIKYWRVKKDRNNEEWENWWKRQENSRRSKNERMTEKTRNERMIEKK